MRHIGLGACLLLAAGCSNGEVRSEMGPLVASATAALDSVVEPDLAGEQPTVLLRCEEGRIGAYVVTGEFDDQPAENQMVRISLDSAPEC